jgi:hypothetical protein
MFFGMAGFYAVSVLFHWLISDPTIYSRFIMLIILGFTTIFALSVYFVTTYMLQVPQAIFGDNFADRIVKRFKR